MKILSICGGKPLYGTVTVSGAKNAVLPLLAATALHGGVCQLAHCPHLTDVDATVHILVHLGCRVCREGDTITVDSRQIGCPQIPRELMRQLRSSVIFLGALLARCGEARIWLPGGCCIGARPIDLHLRALRQLGVEVAQEEDAVRCTARHLHGGTVTLPFPSVGATENLLLTAMGASEPVTVVNAAREPEVTALAGLLRRMGAQVAGEGSSVIHLCAPRQVRDVRCTVVPDRIEAATYLCALAACGGELAVRAIPPELLRPVLDALARSGVALRCEPDRIIARGRARHAIAPVHTAPYPAFPTDAQAPLMAALLRTNGTTLLEETMFEHRFRHVEALRAMGAHITLHGRVAAIHGVRALHGANVAATDLRGGAAMVLAALAAEGDSTVTETQHIFRGYEHLCHKLTSVGASIVLRSEPMEDPTNENQ